MAKINSRNSNIGGLMLTELSNNPTASEDDYPGTGQWNMYAKSSGLHMVDDAGTVTEISGVGGVITQLTYSASTTLTIDSDAITITQTMHQVDTEGAAGTDDLSTINNGTFGDTLILRSVSAARVITLKHGVGNIHTPGNADIMLDNPKHSLELYYDGADWIFMTQHIDISGLSFITSSPEDLLSNETTLATALASPPAIGGTTAAEGTFTGLTVANTGVGVISTIGGDAGRNRILEYETSSVDRWWIAANNVAEAGSDAGSNLLITAFDDSGTTLGSALQITRATRDVKIFTDLEIGGDLNHDGSNIGFYGATPVPQVSFAAPTGLELRTTFNPATVTLELLARRVAAMINDDRAMGKYG